MRLIICLLALCAITANAADIGTFKDETGKQVFLSDKLCDNKKQYKFRTKGTDKGCWIADTNSIKIYYQYESETFIREFHANNIERIK